MQSRQKKKKKKKIRMLNSLANYLLGGNITGGQGSREGSNNQIPEACPVMARLRQVEVEGDDWILIDRAESPASSTTSSLDSNLGEGASALEESWYLTPPPCFTRAGPVNVETSPLEDLLIEHPSMSVYRATASPVAPETPPPTPDAPDERNVEENVVLRDVVPGASVAMATQALPERRNPRRSQIAEQEDRRPSIHDGRPPADRSRTTEQRIAQLRSAQKVLEKRCTQALKRGRLERSNKLREVFSVKGKRPRRQDRLRIQNSGANNNRKC
ncbi:tumor protein p53-inducible nuclear protein 2 isoform X6 [Frieseomelitta varia]|uniref:tumor protein p53-inducible nuclear protein 2 isoform X6 n=1 Tax=Frieseomelitta varia TaxID=561572 RepID=UPI001CB682D4|nr:tumor protein p53-inducible nuclear protein 2 isoform X6 [Frieseomelitta varia]